MTIIGRAATLVLAAIIMALATWGAWQSRELARVRERVQQNALRTDSIEAARDTTRAVSLSPAVRATVGQSVGDSARLYQRRIVQTQQVADSLDRALGVERAARYRVEARVVSLEAESRATADATDSSDVRTARFGVRQEPYYLDVVVALPRPPAEGRMTARVSLDTAVFEARVGCGALTGAGIRPATLTLAGPRWVNVHLSRLEQAARVCSPSEAKAAPVLPWNRRVLSRVASRVAFTVGYAVIVAPGGRVEGGLGAGVGFRFGW